MAQVHLHNARNPSAAIPARYPAARRYVALLDSQAPAHAFCVAALPDVAVTDRTSMNTWEDKAIELRLNGIGKNRIVLAGLWTSVCIVGPALSAIDQDYEVYIITDACGDVSDEAHERAVQRMIQAGAQPMTSLQYLLELQRDWARGATYDQTVAVAKSWGGAYGLGLIYANTMLPGHSEADAAKSA